MNFCTVEKDTNSYYKKLIDLPEWTRQEMYSAAEHILYSSINTLKGLNQILADFGEDDNDIERLEMLYDLEYQDFVEIMAHRILYAMPEKCEEYLGCMHVKKTRGWL